MTLNVFKIHRTRKVQNDNMFGITDPWIWAAYIGCAVTVVFCCVYGWLKKDEEDGDD